MAKVEVIKSEKINNNGTAILIFIIVVIVGVVIAVILTESDLFNTNGVMGKWVEYDNPENTIVFNNSTVTFTMNGEKSTFKYEGKKAITIYSPGEATEIHCIVEHNYEQLQCGQVIYVREINN